MDRQRRLSFIGGLLLVLLGAWFLAAQFVPGLGNLLRLELTWPLLILGFGVLLLVLGLLFGVAAMAIPASIVGGIGALLYWQNATGSWASWSYLWTLIPGFVGVGIFLSELLSGRLVGAIRRGGGLILISLVLFGLFATIFGGEALFGPYQRYWPVLLILLGLWIMVRPRKRSSTS